MLRRRWKPQQRNQHPTNGAATTARPLLLRSSKSRLYIWNMQILPGLYRGGESTNGPDDILDTIKSGPTVNYHGKTT